MDYFAAIRAFLQVSELGSFSKAAQRLEVKTSTVSRQINALEQDLGITLFNRSTRGIRLTEGGHRFHDHALKVMETLEEARSATSRLNEAPQGKLRIALPRAYGKLWIVPHLSAFMTQFPYIDLDIVFSDHALNLIDAELDLAIRIGRLNNSRLVARKLAPHHRVLCATPEFASQYGLPQYPDQLPDFPAVRLGSMDEEHWWFSQPDTPLVPLQLRGRLRATDDEAILQLVMTGNVMALLPQWLVAQKLNDGTLIQVLADWHVKEGNGTGGTFRQGDESAVWAVYTQKKTVSSKVRAFIDYFSAVLKTA